jgi:hypothetical protein
VTLGRLVLAWSVVALWFVAVTWVTERRRNLTGAGGEALILTLIASLWFDTLGHGGWWLLFLLLGTLAAFPARLRQLESGASPAGRAALLGLVDAGRYVGAGAMLAWRLG